MKVFPLDSLKSSIPSKVAFHSWIVGMGQGPMVDPFVVAIHLSLKSKIGDHMFLHFNMDLMLWALLSSLLGIRWVMAWCGKVFMVGCHVGNKNKRKREV